MISMCCGSYLKFIRLIFWFMMLGVVWFGFWCFFFFFRVGNCFVLIWRLYGLIIGRGLSWFYWKNGWGSFVICWLMCWWLSLCRGWVIFFKFFLFLVCVICSRMCWVLLVICLIFMFFFCLLLVLLLLLLLILLFDCWWRLVRNCVVFSLAKMSCWNGKVKMRLVNWWMSIIWWFKNWRKVLRNFGN